MSNIVVNIPQVYQFLFIFKEIFEISKEGQIVGCKDYVINIKGKDAKIYVKHINIKTCNKL